MANYQSPKRVASLNARLAAGKKRRPEPVLVEAQITRLDQELRRITARIEAHHDRMNKLDQRMDQTLQKLAEQSAFTGHWGERVQRLEASLNGCTKNLDERMNHLNATLHDLTKRTRSMERGIVAELMRTGSIGPKLMFDNQSADGAGDRVTGGTRQPKVTVSAPSFVVDAPEAKDLHEIECQLDKLSDLVSEMRTRKR